MDVHACMCACACMNACVGAHVRVCMREIDSLVNCNRVVIKYPTPPKCIATLSCEILRSKNSDSVKHVL